MRRQGHGRPGLGQPGSGGTPGPAGTPAPAATPAPAGTGPPGAPANAPPFPADTRADAADPAAGTQLSVVDVRVARQDGYDRVVYELAGRGAPGWRVAWVDEPAEQATGDLVRVAGDVALSVSLSGVGVPDDVGVPSYAGPDLVDASALPRLYDGAVRPRHLLGALVAGVLALGAAISVTPVGQQWVDEVSPSVTSTT